MGVIHFPLGINLPPQFGTGQHGNLVVTAGTVNYQDIYELAVVPGSTINGVPNVGLNNGVGTYNRTTNAVPNWVSIVINPGAAITTLAYDGNANRKGNIVIRSIGNVSIPANGIIGTGKGFRGGAGAPAFGGATIGEGPGAGGVGNGASENGAASGAAGASYGTLGGVATDGRNAAFPKFICTSTVSAGVLGATYGNTSLTPPQMGSGGSGGGATNNGGVFGGVGGIGGAIIEIYALSITATTDSIQNNGSNGTNGKQGGGGINGSGSAGSGASGGSVLLETLIGITAAANFAKALGGIAGLRGFGGCQQSGFSGNGGKGRIHIIGSFTGTTDPVAA